MLRYLLVTNLGLSKVINAFANKKAWNADMAKFVNVKSSRELSGSLKYRIKKVSKANIKYELANTFSEIL
jgi:hypothetical protein